MASDADNSIKAGLYISKIFREYDTDGAQLLKLVLIAAIHAPGSQKNIGRMLQLSEATQTLLMKLITDVNKSIDTSCYL